MGGGLVGSSSSINKVDVFLIKTKIYTLLVSHIQGRPSSQSHCAMALVVFLPRPENQGKIWVLSPLFSSAELYYLQTAQCQADGQSLLHLRLVSLVMIQVQVG